MLHPVTHLIQGWQWLRQRLNLGMAYKLTFDTLTVRLLWLLLAVLLIPLSTQWIVATYHLKQAVSLAQGYQKALLQSQHHAQRQEVCRGVQHLSLLAPLRLVGLVSIPLTASVPPKVSHWSADSYQALRRHAALAPANQALSPCWVMAVDQQPWLVWYTATHAVALPWPQAVASLPAKMLLWHWQALPPVNSPQPVQAWPQITLNKASLPQLWLALAPTATPTLPMDTPLTPLLSHYKFSSYGVLLMGLACSLALAFWGSRQVVRPVYQLIGELKHITLISHVQPKLGKPLLTLPQGVIVEVEQLVSGVNALWLRLGQLLGRQHDFVTALTHDLKVPLLAQRQTLAQLAKGTYGTVSPQQAQAFALLQQSSADTLTLVNCLLDVARYEQAEVKLNTQPTALYPLVQAEIAQLTSLAQAKHLNITVTPPAPPTTDDLIAYVDEAEVKRVLQNVLGNALRLSPSYGTLKITLCAAATLLQPLAQWGNYQRRSLERPYDLTGYVLLVVEDEGLGFTPPSFEQLFTRYASVGTGQREPLHHGLGLYYCYHVLQAHGGLLWVETTEGQGSAVVMAWPHTAQVMLTAKQGATHDRRRS